MNFALVTFGGIGDQEIPPFIAMLNLKTDICISGVVPMFEIIGIEIDTK